MKILQLSLVAIVSLIAAGCSTIQPMDIPENLPASPDKAVAAAELSEAWNKDAVQSEGRASVVLLTPTAVPANVRSQRISLELEPDATIKDVVAVMGRLGHSIVLADSEVGGKKFFMPRYNGSLGGLLSAISRATDVWFTWEDGTIMVSAAEKIGISIPQEKTFAEDLAKGLEALGVKEKSVHWQSGMAVLQVTPVQFRKVKTFLERYTSNAAVVTLNVAVINVSLNQNAKQGIDWERLQLSIGSGASPAQVAQRLSSLNPPTSTTLPNTTTSTNSTPTGSGAGAGDTSTSGTSQKSVSSSVGAVTLTGSSLGGAILTNRFNFQALFNFLQSYGTAETKQNVLLKTVAGNKVEFKSVTQIPYVSEVGVTTTTSTSSTSALGSSKTDKAEDGITVELTPVYDSAANSVTVDLKLAIKAVVAFNELSAGNQLGKLTQPTTAERSFTDTLRLRPGQTVVVGGLTYDSVSDNRGAPIFLTGSRLESQSLTVNRQSMFIVVKPSILRLGQLQVREVDGELDLLPEPASKKGGFLTDDDKASSASGVQATPSATGAKEEIIDTGGAAE
jgi:type II secretory pathway component GspD/PulD (secretin)